MRTFEVKRKGKSGELLNRGQIIVTETNNIPVSVRVVWSEDTINTTGDILLHHLIKAFLDSGYEVEKRKSR